MSLHFEGAEFSQRINRLRELMAENELDGMLLFRQESMFYLSGYDTFGYVFFTVSISRSDVLRTELRGE